MSVETVLQLVRRIQHEFREMPGLRVTLEQAQRRWNMDELISQQILEALVADNFLARARDGTFIRAM